MLLLLFFFCLSLFVEWWSFTKYCLPFYSIYMYVFGRSLSPFLARAHSLTHSRSFVWLSVCVDFWFLITAFSRSLTGPLDLFFLSMFCCCFFFFHIIVWFLNNSMNGTGMVNVRSTHDTLHIGNVVKKRRECTRVSEYERVRGDISFESSQIEWNACQYCRN